MGVDWFVQHNGVEVSLSGRAMRCVLPPGGKGTVFLRADTAAMRYLKTSPVEVADPEVAEIRLRSVAGAFATYEVLARGEGTTQVEWTPHTPSFGIAVGPYASHFAGCEGQDVIARVCSRGEIGRTALIQEILDSNTDLDAEQLPRCVIDQLKGKFGMTKAFNCQETCERAGSLLFDNRSSGGQSYHRPLILKKMQYVCSEDITYDERVTQQAVRKIAARISQGQAVVLGLAYYVSYYMLTSLGRLNPNSSGGHSVLVVAYDGVSKFLYLDPMPSGSITTFKGGPSRGYEPRCVHMGVLEIRRTNKKGMFIGGSPTAQGKWARDYEVIQGPL